MAQRIPLDEWRGRIRTALSGGRPLFWAGTAMRAWSPPASGWDMLGTTACWWLCCSAVAAAMRRSSSGTCCSRRGRSALPPWE